MGVFDTENNEGETPPIVDNNAAPPVDIWAEKLKTIVREDGTPKYQSVDAALEALTASQNHITQLEAEAKILADKARETETLKEQLERLGKKMNEEKPVVGTPQANGGLSAEAAKELVQNILKGERETEVAINNIKSVQNSLVSKFGSEKAAQEAVVAKAKELGVSLEKLKQDSATSPNLVLALFGNAKPSPAPNVATINLSRPQPTDEQIKRPEKSVLSGRGATDQNQTDLMRQIRESIHKKHGITV